MKPALLETLKATLVGDTAKLTQASQTLSELSKNHGYCINLMEIIDDQSVQVPVKQAALIQLKNTIRSRWKVKNQKDSQINSEEKNLIKNALVMAVIRCAKIHILIKLYRQIITIIVCHQFRDWLPVNQIITWLQKNQNLQPCMECLIAIASNFQFSIIPKDRQFFNKLLLFVMPKILEMIKRNQANPQIVYLSLKFLWKTVHYDLSRQAKIMCFDWMQLIHNTITAYNESCQANLDEFHQKYTLQFYYYHSKKWATRIILRFLQKHAKDTIYGQEIVDNKDFSKKWHEEYGPVFLKDIMEQMKIPTIKKVRYFQFKCLQAWTNDRPILLTQYVPIFQYQILPQYLKIKPQDETLANSDPIEYLAIEEEPSLSFTNLKRAATDLWVAMFQIGSSTDTKRFTYNPGKFFNENLNYLVNNLNGNNLLEKQFSMYLLCQIRYIITRVKEANKQLIDMFPKLILPQFQNSVMFLRMRANDIFIQYGKEKFQIQIIEKAAQRIYTCLSSDPSPLVRIKAASAFHNILIHPNAKGLVTPLLKDILQIYLKLIEAYDIQELVKGLEHIVTNFAEDISPYAIDLFKYLSQLFIKLFHKDIEQNRNNDDYEGETQLTASGCLKTMAQIISSPLSLDMRKQLQENVLEMCYFVLCQQSVDYSQDILGLLNVHLFKIEVMSHSLWFFFQVVIYFLVGIPKQFWAHLQKIAMPDKYKKLLLNIKDSQNIEYFEHAMPVIRNYISKFAKFMETQSPEFKQNFIQIQFYLIGSTYKLHSRELSDGEIDLDCCTMIIIYLSQLYEEQLLAPMFPPIWSYIKFNFAKSRTYCLRAITSTLMGVLFWRIPVPFIKMAMSENLLNFAIMEMIKYNNHLDETHQKKRIILGILSLLMLPEKPQEIISNIAVLFKTLLKLLKSNARTYIIKYMDKNKLNNEDLGINHNDEEEEEEIYNLPNDDDVEYSDEEDLWDESYHQYYNSPLENHNQLIYFRDCFLKLKTSEPSLYQLMIGCVPEKELGRIDSYVEKAIATLSQ